MLSLLLSAQRNHALDEFGHAGHAFNTVQQYSPGLQASASGQMEHQQPPARPLLMNRRTKGTDDQGTHNLTFAAGARAVVEEAAKHLGSLDQEGTGC